MPTTIWPWGPLETFRGDKFLTLRASTAPLKHALHEDNPYMLVLTQHGIIILYNNNMNNCIDVCRYETHPR